MYRIVTRRRNSTALWNDLAFFALELLRDNDGTMSLSDLMNVIAKEKVDIIPKDSMSKYSNTRDTRRRWEVNVQFECDKFVKAAFLRKQRGVWHLTAAGEKALQEGKHYVTDTATRALRTYKEKKQRIRENNAAKLLSVSSGRDAPDSASTDTPADAIPEVGVEEHINSAINEITKYIREMEAYEFQDLCAALLRGMGYHVRDVAAPGPDGGIDIIAYTDPLGGTPPRLKVQVKHQEAKAGIPALTHLSGLLRDGDIGVFISSGGFAAGCRDMARRENNHLELMDLPRFIELWREHYKNIAEEDRTMLPLTPVYFLNKKGTDE